VAQALRAPLRVVGGLDHDGDHESERVLLTTTLVVDNMQCGGCMSSIERALRATPGVTDARANLSARRVTVVSDAVDADAQTLIEALDRAGFRAAEALDRDQNSADDRAQDLLRRLGVAGFAAANVMLLSVSVWAGLASDMDQAAQGLFHWLSALIAMPAIAYSAQPFFRSAATALKARRLNMDVPISLGITLATAMSLFQTTRGSDQVYFDAAIMLTFFLLIGRYLDELVRVRARGAAENLLGLKALSATVIGADGLPRRLAARALEPGMRVLVAAGERIPVDGKVIEGKTEIDASLITGETTPALVKSGSVVHAGTMNLGQPIMVQATATDDNTLVAEIARLMLAAEQGRGHYVRLADRAARLYAPAVHVLGATTFIGWMLAGGGWEQALTCAIAVLIITCPCALALAVPAVQVAATSRLFARGIIVKAADGLERLAEVDTVVFDKTGTLTRGEPSLRNATDIDAGTLASAAALALASRHPYALAVVKAARERGLQVRPESGVTEIPGSGLTATDHTGRERRLGSMAWVLGDGIHPQGADTATLWYAETGSAPVGFEFDDAPRSDAGNVVGALRSAGFDIELLSGDREHAVRTAAHAVGIGRWFAGVRPDGKIARIEALGGEGRRVLMVGDGLNDAPALAAAHASLSPSSAADISQNAADAVFQGEKLGPVLEALGVAQAAQRMAVQNFAIAIAYNIVSVPLAMAGHVTPLIAALAMSLSSIAVTGNALRLRSCKVALARVDRSSSGETP
jgi:Cu2+-exporting ATPase